MIYIPAAYAGLRRKNAAFESLEKAYEQRSRQHEMIFAAVDPRFDSLRSDPRFDVFLRRAGLPPQPRTRLAPPGSSSNN